MVNVYKILLFLESPQTFEPIMVFIYYYYIRKVLKYYFKVKI